MRHLLLALALLANVLIGCSSTRIPESPAGSHFCVLTYNVNWGAPGAHLTADILKQSEVEIICLQETTPQWERFLKDKLSVDYPYAQFRNSAGRMGGGLAFLSKKPGTEIAYIPSETGWFDGWIMLFETAAGPVQVLNVHLRPPVSERGSWVTGYFTTRDERLREIEHFYSKCRPDVPMLVMGDFNEGEDQSVVRFLRSKGMINALPEFDSKTPTWQWRYRGVTLSRRMDHIIYSRELYCSSARVIRGGASDHFPVEAIFTPGRKVALGEGERISK